MFEQSLYPKIKVSKSLKKLQAMGGIDKILPKIRTDPDQGINGDENDISRRISKFGTNEPAPSVETGFFY